MKDAPTASTLTWPTEPGERLGAQMKMLKEINEAIKETRALSRRGVSAPRRAPTTRTPRPTQTPSDVPGDAYTKGETLRVAGERGRFTFIRFDGKTIHCWGGSKFHEMFRSFVPERVRRA